MIKNIFFLVLLLSSISVKAQVTVNIQWQNIKPVNADDVIHYNIKKKLTWPDFKGNPNEASPAAAVTESGFGYQLAMKSLNRITSINIIVYCYFDKNKSWVKKGMNTDYGLLHEQHHFDITYINTCIFIQKLKAAKFTRSNFSALSAKIHDECFIALNNMQNQYDGETSNGRKKELQAYWNKKIDQQLAAFITN